MLLKRISWVFLLLLATTASVMAGPTPEAGKELFVGQCAACHAKNMKDKLTGPALSGVEERWSGYPRKDLYAWVRNSQALIATGHKRANELWDQNKPTLMNSFPNLTDEQIESILLYVNAVVNQPAPPPPPPGSAAANESAGGIPWMYVGLASLLALLTFALMRIVDNLSNVARVQAGDRPLNKSWTQTLTSKGFIAFIVFATTLIFGYKTVDNATRLGRAQNYQPDQPIKFSHKLHAGTNKIDCQYCHDSARRSKSSSVPGANTCMNCHAAVKKGSQYGTAELTKIFASIGFDPTTSKYIDGYENYSEEQIKKVYTTWIGQEYLADAKLAALDENGTSVVNNQWEEIVKALKNDSNGKIQGPIEWTRIHNLADHVYFNHAQHVAVGQIACQKCHGPVQEMEVVRQYSTLGMGWCISCHRETEVKFKDNGYYDQFERYHKELATKDKEGNPVRTKVTVEDVGGLECQKCHY